LSITFVEYCPYFSNSTSSFHLSAVTLSCVRGVGRYFCGVYRKLTKAALTQFLSEAPLHLDQITYLDEVVNYLVKNGIMEAMAMLGTPFTNINDQGVLGVFGENVSKKPTSEMLIKG
jgi:hypothetical protein